MTQTIPVTVTVNEKVYQRQMEPRMLLSDFLRHELGLTGTHVGCEHGVCGACTILFDGESALVVMGIIAVLPNFFLGLTGSGQNQNFPFGGTAVLIMVGVGLDTVKQIESQLKQRKYEGFLR